MPRASASATACGFSFCAARMPRHADFAGSSRMNPRYRVSCSTASIVPMRLISTATHSPVVVLAHQVDRAHLRRPFALHERQLLAERRGGGGQLELQIALDAVLLQRRRLAHVVPDVAEDLREPDLEHVLRLRLPDDEHVAELLGDRRPRHPVQRLVAARVVVDEHGPVGLQDQQPHRLGQDSRQATGVADLAAGDEQAHDPHPIGPCGRVLASRLTGMAQQVRGFGWRPFPARPKNRQHCIVRRPAQSGC